MAIKLRRERLYPPIEMAQGVALGLDEVEWERIVDRLGRPPNHFECSIFATLWSEQVSNKSSAALLQTISREEDGVLRIPGTKLGLTKIDDNAYLALRVCHNNAQTSLEPFYGSQTAINLALEELASVGAVPLGILNLLRFGSYDLIRNQRMFQGAVEGIGAYGCKFGIPIVGGELYFHERYNHAVMSNSGVAGVLTNEQALVHRTVDYHSPVLYVGAATGRDGLRRPNDPRPDKFARSLKISDPLLASRIVNAAAEATERGILRELVCVGAGGLAVACFELARRVNRPVLLDIDRIPLRGEGYEPLEIILSETTERVLMVIDKQHHRALNQILYKWDLESIKVGEVNDSDGIEFYYNHYLAADIPFQFALGGAVQRQFQVVQFPPMLKRSARVDDDADKMRRKKRKVDDEWSLVREVSLAKHDEREKEFPCPVHLDDVWLDMLANPNLCSRAPVYRMFDQVIGASTVQRPGGDASVFRLTSLMTGAGGRVMQDLIKQLPEGGGNGHKAGPSGKVKPGEIGVALTFDSNSLYVSMEPYLGTVQTVAEGMRNLAAVGAHPIGLAYCLNFGSPERYREVCDLAEAIRGLGDASRIWHIPILSEEICLNNGTEGNPVLPTPAVLMAGRVNDLGKTCGIGFRGKNDIILLLGLTENEIGCSEYASYAHKAVNRLVPDIEFAAEKTTCELIIALIQHGLLRSAHDLSGGGLAIALTECCMMRPRPIGATFHIDPQSFDTPNGPVPLRPDAALFSETSARFLISCKPEHEEKVREFCAESSVPVTGSGTVGGKSIIIEGAANAELPLSTTYKLWIHRLEILLGQGGEETVGF